MDKERFEWIIKWLQDAELNDWETNFIESIDKQFERKGYLTTNQEDVLERIYREKG